ncbi:MAG: S-methyl-5-thioribose-1-phosphate isomerase [Burkholderiales bacterium]
MNAVETLRWCNGALELIDQRILPQRFEYVSCESAAAVAEAIRAMVVRGAPAIGCAAAFGIAVEAARLQELPEAQFEAAMERAFSVLAASRPTAVNLSWALSRMRKVWQQTSGRHQAREKLLREAHAIREEDIRANREMGRHGAALIEDGARVLTHCNAGALATAGHGTALGVIRSAMESGKKISIIADETRPFLQGARLTAWELAQDNIPVTLIADSAAGLLMRRKEIDAIIVGADRIAGNGDVANKIGTYMLAVLASHHGIPFYVAAPLSTIDLSLASGAEIPIEERGADELRGFGDSIWAEARTAARNPVFDVTPHELVTGLITERGVVLSPDSEKLRRLFTFGKPEL